jgi:hypothetical protein
MTTRINTVPGTSVAFLSEKEWDSLPKLRPGDKVKPNERYGFSFSVEFHPGQFHVIRTLYTVEQKDREILITATPATIRL